MITPDQARLARDSNRRIVVGTQDVAIAKNQVLESLRAGLEVQLYIFHYPEVALARELGKAMEVFEALDDEACFGIGTPFVWLDFEADFPLGLDADVILGWIDRARKMTMFEFGPNNVGIYTRRSWWEANTDNSTEFSHLPLWDANYDAIGDLSVFTPYGGWTAATMKQYLVNFDLYGMTVDLNVF